MTCVPVGGSANGGEPDNVVETAAADWAGEMEEAINNGGEPSGVPQHRYPRQKQERSRARGRIQSTSGENLAATRQASTLEASMDATRQICGSEDDKPGLGDLKWETSGCGCRRRAIATAGNRSRDKPLYQARLDRCRKQLRAGG